jgi:uncharacterized membrane protein YphA (DoxX/SURF4 family)
LALGLIFLVTGVSKLLQPYIFLSSVYAYGLTGPTTGFWVARLLPWLEVTTGSALLFGVLKRGAGAASMFLSVVFVYVKFHAIHEDKQIGCGCIVSADRGLIGVSDLVWVVAVLLLAGIVLFLSTPSTGPAGAGQEASVSPRS